MLGCLVEKQRTTPDVYPLTLNALRLACNQSSNRDPVVDYDDGEIRAALDRLIARKWATLASWSNRRAMKYRHTLDSALGLSGPEIALLCVLMLRGSQTPGELKQRTERLHGFAGVEEVEETLAGLIDRGLAARLGRRPGQREERFAQLLEGEAARPRRRSAAPPPDAPAAQAPEPHRAAAGRGRPRGACGGTGAGGGRAACGAAVAAPRPVTPRPGMLARGPWTPEQVAVRWRDEPYEPPAEVNRRADDAVSSLRARGSPAHDGMATRLAGWEADGGRLELELQPARWALRLVEDDAADSLTALCVVRTADGRWLAGRRAGWVSTWANRWALGAGGAVDLGESPARTLSRELDEEWRLVPDTAERGGAGGSARRRGDGGGTGHRGRRLRAGARRRARRLGLVARRRRGLAGGGRPAAAGDGAAAWPERLRRRPRPPGSSRRCRPARSTRPGSWPGTAGGSPPRRRTRERPRSPW